MGKQQEGRHEEKKTPPKTKIIGKSPLRKKQPTRPTQTLNAQTLQIFTPKSEFSSDSLHDFPNGSDRTSISSEGFHIFQQVEGRTTHQNFRQFFSPQNLNNLQLASQKQYPFGYPYHPNFNYPMYFDSPNQRNYQGFQNIVYFGLFQEVPLEQRLKYRFPEKLNQAQARRERNQSWASEPIICRLKPLKKTQSTEKIEIDLNESDKKVVQSFRELLFILSYEKNVDEIEKLVFNFMSDELIPETLEPFIEELVNFIFDFNEEDFSTEDLLDEIMRGLQTKKNSATKVLSKFFMSFVEKNMLSVKYFHFNEGQKNKFMADCFQLNIKLSNLKQRIQSKT